MKKPERVEAGQWWTIGDDAPWRIEGTGTGLEWLIDPTHPGYTGYHIYLGSGDHPEPSAWMIETLAEHAYDIGRARLPPTWAGYPEDKRSNWRYCARRTLSGESDILNEQLTDAMLSLYRILRSLGKW